MSSVTNFLKMETDREWLSCHDTKSTWMSVGWITATNNELLMLSYSKKGSHYVVFITLSEQITEYNANNVDNETPNRSSKI